MTQTKQGYQWDPSDVRAREGAPVKTQRVIELAGGAIVVAERAAAGPVLVSPPLDVEAAAIAVLAIGAAGDVVPFVRADVVADWPAGKVLAEVDAEFERGGVR